jgi:hypothetical protein
MASVSSLATCEVLFAPCRAAPCRVVPMDRPAARAGRSSSSGSSLARRVCFALRGARRQLGRTCLPDARSTSLASAGAVLVGRLVRKSTQATKSAPAMTPAAAAPTSDTLSSAPVMRACIVGGRGGGGRGDGGGGGGGTGSGLGGAVGGGACGGGICGDSGGTRGGSGGDGGGDKGSGGGGGGDDGGGGGDLVEWQARDGTKRFHSSGTPPSMLSSGAAPSHPLPNRTGMLGTCSENSLPSTALQKPSSTDWHCWPRPIVTTRTPLQPTLIESMAASRRGLSLRGDDAACWLGAPTKDPSLALTLAQTASCSA